MARLRKAVAYRNLERPYTRKSKFKKNNFVRGSPVIKVVRFEMGNKSQKNIFSSKLYLKADESMQIRQNSLESARLAINRLLEGNLTNKGFFCMLRIYPHHILRENPLASGAGADRMSTGMKKSFGKTISVAAQVKQGNILFEVRVNKENIALAKKALHKASTKLPCSCRIEIIE